MARRDERDQSTGTNRRGRERLAGATTQLEVESGRLQGVARVASRENELGMCQQAAQTL